jgi:hypothetical protein
MGGASPEELEEAIVNAKVEAKAEIEAEKRESEGVSLSADIVDEQGQIQDRPESAEEAKLYENANYACTWSDANEYSFRLRQVELINFLIRYLSSELFKNADNIQYNIVHEKSMIYKNAFDEEDLVHNYEILSQDPLFIPQDKKITFFEEYKTKLLVVNAGSDNETKKREFQAYLSTFVRVRDRLVIYMFKNCKSKVSRPPPGAEGPENRGEGPQPPTAEVTGGRGGRGGRRYR